MGTKLFLERNLPIPIVGIKTSIAEHLLAIKKNQNKYKKIAILNYGKIGEDSKLIFEMVDSNIKIYEFDENHDAEKCVKEAAEDGFDVIIGGISASGYADKYNIRHIEIENTDESIRTAIDSAKQILSVRENEKIENERLNIQNERYRMVLNYTHDAIFAVDEKCDITLINEKACQIIDAPEKELIGRNINRFIKNSRMDKVIATETRELDQLMDINGCTYMTNRTPIITDNMVRGAVAAFRDIRTIQENEERIRIKLFQKGMTAKYIFDDIIGSSEAIKSTINIAKGFAKAEYTVLITGEAGVGKELFAQSIHNLSERKNKPFVAVNCAAIPKNLIEAELFGYVDGAFTGASKGGRAGLFESAHSGTIFLDEIGELPIETQAQLLRVLQEKEVRRIGSEKVLPIDVRVIAATNRDIEREIEAGNFRKDLYYRLDVLNLEIPPLRERENDFIEIGLNIFKGTMKERYSEYEGDMRKMLKLVKHYCWPGNIRELTNFVEKLTTMYNQSIDNVQIFNIINRAYKTEVLSRDTEREENSGVPDRVKKVKDLERDKILKELEENNFNITKTAAALRMGRSTLYRKMERYQLV